MVRRDISQAALGPAWQEGLGDWREEPGPGLRELQGSVVLNGLGNGFHRRAGQGGQGPSRWHVSRALKFKGPEDKMWLGRKEPEKCLRNGVNKGVDVGKA